MKPCWLILFLALPLVAATTNFVQVTGTVMQGQDKEFAVVNPTNLACATGGLVTNNDPHLYVTITHGPTVGSGTGIGGHSIYQWVVSNLVYVTELQTCTNTHNHLLWWDASAGVTPAINGASITEVDDQSGNGYNGTSGSSSPYQPVYETNIINGHPVMRFTGGVELLTNLAVTCAQPYFITIVAQVTPEVANRNIYESQAADSTNGYIELLTLNNSNLLMYAIQNGTLSYIQPTNRFPASGFHVITAVYNTDNSSLRRDGVQIGPGSIYDVLPIQNAIIIGFRLDPAFTSSADVGELIIDTDLSQISATEAYLTAKYGL